MRPTFITDYKQQQGCDRFLPQLFLFDMDGVLYDSMPNHATAWVQAMHEVGLKMKRIDAYLTEGQKGTDTIIQICQQQRGTTISQQQAQEIYDRKAQIFARLPKPPIMQGIPELMQCIKQQGWQIGIVTGSGQRPLIRRIKKDFRRFVPEQHIVTAYDVLHGKPHPEPYLKGMQQAGITEPWRVVVVENAPLGIQAGVAAGCFTIGIATGLIKQQQLRQAGAHLTFKSVNQFLEYWNKFISAVFNHQERWEQTYEQITNFVNDNKRRPSKHRPEELPMHNWIKHNRKLQLKNELPEKRNAQFQQLQKLIQQYQRINQYAYRNEELTIPFQD